MISNAFKGAYTNEVAQRNQGIQNISSGVKDVATVVAGALGFSGALGTGALAQGAEHALANRVGGVGGNIMLASLKEKTETRKANLNSEAIISSGKEKDMKTVYDQLMTKEGMIASPMGDVDPNSKLGKQILEQLSQEDEPVKEGYTRLYRGISGEYDKKYDPKKKDNPEGYESWTEDYDLAKAYGKDVYYTDIKTSDIKSSYLDEDPKSETYGDRHFVYKNDKPVGINDKKGNEFLMYTEHEDYQKQTINKSRRK